MRLRAATVIAAAALLMAAAIWAARNDERAPRASARAEPAARGTNFAAQISMDAVNLATKGAEPAAQSNAKGSQSGSPSLHQLENSLEAAEPGREDLVVGELLPRLVAHDARAAARFAELQEDHYLREISLRLVAQHWSRLDTEAALAWAASLGDPRERDDTISDVTLALAQDDPRRAIAIRERYAGAGARDAALVAMGQQWAMKDFDAALAWAEQQADPTQRTDLLQRLTFVRAETGDHLAAAQLAADRIADDRARQEALAMVAAHWAYRDLPAARAWARTLEGQTRERMEREIAPFEVR
jgi:hypothetical protein